MFPPMISLSVSRSNSNVFSHSTMDPSKDEIGLPLSAIELALSRSMCWTLDQIDEQIKRKYCSKSTDLGSCDLTNSVYIQSSVNGASDSCTAWSNSWKTALNVSHVQPTYDENAIDINLSDCDLRMRLVTDWKVSWSNFIRNVID